MRLADNLINFGRYDTTKKSRGQKKKKLVDENHMMKLAMTK